MTLQVEMSSGSNDLGFEVSGRAIGMQDLVREVEENADTWEGAGFCSRHLELKNDTETRCTAVIVVP